MFTAALSKIAMIWKQPQCPLPEKWIKMWCLYTMEYYTAIRQNESMPSAATRRDPEIIPLSEANHKKKDKYHMISLMWNQKCDSRSVTSESLGPHGL